MCLLGERSVCVYNNISWLSLPAQILFFPMIPANPHTALILKTQLLCLSILFPQYIPGCHCLSKCSFFPATQSLSPTFSSTVLKEGEEGRPRPTTTPSRLLSNASSLLNASSSSNASSLSNASS